MSTEEIKVIIRRLKKLMYGYNYEVGFDVTLFETCYRLANAIENIKTLHSDFDPYVLTPLEINAKEFWEEINFGLSYRGDYGSGLKLSREKEIELELEQDKYKSFIGQLIRPKTKFYSVPLTQGIFWEYHFLLANGDHYWFIEGWSFD